MDKEKALKHIPLDKSVTQTTKEERRDIAENLVEEIISQIEGENRNPSIWEQETITYALGLMISGAYIAAINEAMSCFLGKDEVAKPGYWWNEADDISTVDLRKGLGKARAVTSRGN